eukprot:SAG22_NODE_11008_length_505_cov_0.958128_2_plen_110_part_01
MYTTPAIMLGQRLTDSAASSWAILAASSRMSSLSFLSTLRLPVDLPDFAPVDLPDRADRALPPLPGVDPRCPPAARAGVCGVFDVLADAVAVSTAADAVSDAEKSGAIEQ